MWRKIVDGVIEAPVVTSFTNIGYQARKRLDDWRSLDTYDLTGKVIVVTGATSGLGQAAATQLAELGATIVVNGRRAEKNEVVAEQIRSSTGNANVSQVAADMGDLDQVRLMADHILDRHDRLDVLIHNAGALSNKRQVGLDGTEATVASQVVGPFLLTTLLLERLAAAPTPRVLTMSSGGMYAAPLTVSRLEMSEADYNGTEQYARAKRAQITLNELWANKFGDSGVRFHTLHPGWADTPGVTDALPGFAKVIGPLLRTPAEGADTLVWLAADDDTPVTLNGKFWLDRRPRSTHKLPHTKRAETSERRQRLWDWVVERSGATPQR